MQIAGRLDAGKDAVHRTSIGDGGRRLLSLSLGCVKPMSVAEPALRVRRSWPRSSRQSATAERQHQRGKRPARRAAISSASAPSRGAEWPASAGSSRRRSAEHDAGHAQRRRADPRQIARCARLIEPEMAVPAQQHQQGQRLQPARQRSAPAPPRHAPETGISPSVSARLATIAATATLTGVRVFVVREKPGRQHLDEYEGRQPGGIGGECRRGRRRLGRAERAALRTAPAVSAVASTISAAAAGSVSSSASSTPRFCVSTAPAESPSAHLARQRRQDRGADRDADNAERQLVQPVGIVEIGDRAARQQRGERGRDQQVELCHPGAEHARPHDAQGLPARAASGAAGAAAAPPRPARTKPSARGIARARRRSAPRPAPCRRCQPNRSISSSAAIRNRLSRIGVAAGAANRSTAFSNPPCNAVSEMNSR